MTTEWGMPLARLNRHLKQQLEAYNSNLHAIHGEPWDN
jgi:hypothetical protein